VSDPSPRLPPGCSFDRTNGGSVYVVGRGHRRVTPLCATDDQAAEMAWEQYAAFHDIEKVP